MMLAQTDARTRASPPPRPAAEPARDPDRGHGLVLGATAEERKRAFRKARRHSVFVRLLKVVAPLLALGSLGLYTIREIKVSIPLPNGGVVETTGVTLENSNAKFSNPSYSGYTPDKGRYDVKAASAMVSGGLAMAKGAKASDDVYLEKVDAKLTQADKNWFSLTAEAGTLRIKAQTLAMKNGIVARSSNGMAVTMAAADVDFATKKLASKSPVVITMPQGRVKATGLDIDGGKKHIIFRSKVEAKLVGTGTPPTPAPQPEKGNRDAFSALGQQSGPVDITAARLEIKDEDKTAVFSGGVKAVRPDSELTGGTMTVVYSPKEKEGGKKQPDAMSPATMGSSPADIQRVEVVDAVRLTSADGRTAEADKLIYDRLGGKVSLIGSVTVAQGVNVLSGGRIDVEIASRHTRVSGPGRITGHFEQPGDTAAKPKPVAESNPANPGLAAGSGPISVEADQLDVYDEKGLAVFKGKVVAQRGDQVIKAEELTLSYAAGKGGGAAGMGGESKLKRMEARGKVSVKAPNEQYVTGDHMVYEAGSNVITVDGNVVVTQGKNVITGDKLVVDLANGATRVVSDGGAKPAAVAGSPSSAETVSRPVKKAGRVSVIITQESAKTLTEQAPAGQAPAPAAEPPRAKRKPKVPSEP